MEEGLICPICESDAIKFFLEKNNFRIYRCDECALFFVWPAPEDLEQIYSENYFKKNQESEFGYVDYESDKAAMRSVFERALDELENLSEGRRIFDVGAATGYFLDLAAGRGWQTAGSEISEYAGSIARDKGHNIFLGHLASVDDSQSHDVITMWDVLEHLARPHDYLSKISRMLEPRGLLLINTIDGGSVWARLMGKRWHAILPPEHLHYFSIESLKKLLERHGFEILVIRKIGKKFSLPYIFRTLGAWQKLDFWHKAADLTDNSFWRKFAVPINLRDNIYLVARKK